jgi:hypothetical protein
MKPKQRIFIATRSALGIFFVGLSSAALADIKVNLMVGSGTSYSDSPTNFENNPTNFKNSSSNYENSSSNFQNSASNFENNLSNPENGMLSKRKLIDKNGVRIGYYVLSENGVLNIYSGNGRVFYRPSGGHTRSIFLSDGNEWCGFLEESDGGKTLNLTEKCMSFLKTSI